LRFGIFPAMDSLSTWLEFLADTDDDAAIIALANEFLNRLNGREFALLPPSCKPRKLHNAADLNGYALDLMRSPSMDPESVVLVQRMMAFLFECAQRLAHNSMRERALLQDDGAAGRQAA